MFNFDLFFSRINFIGPVSEHRPDLGPCWIWDWTRTKNGYGIFYSGYLSSYPHRLMYRIFHGSIPAPWEKEIDHLCRVRACCNPNHLEAVTKKVNVSRSNSPWGINSRKTQCVHGHELSPENTKRDKHGWRRCRECLRTAKREAYRAAVAVGVNKNSVSNSLNFSTKEN